MINILVPSYGRPEAFAEMKESALNTSSGKHPIEIILCIQESDPTYKKYHHDLIITHECSDNLPSFYNKMAQRAKGDLLFCGADDILFQTKDWDDILYQHVPEDGIGILSFDDGRGGDKPCPHPVIPRRFYETLGFLMLPHVKHWCSDTFLRDLAIALDRYIWIPEITVFHRKNFDIETNYYQTQCIKRRNHPKRDNDVFQELKENGWFQEQVDKLKALMT